MNKPNGRIALVITVLVVSLGLLAAIPAQVGSSGDGAGDMVPVPPGTSVVVNEGEEFYFSLTGDAPSWPDYQCVPEDTYAEWNLGNGETALGWLEFPYGYGDDGVYSVVATIDDASGISYSTWEVTVNNVAPVVEAGDTQVVRVGVEMFLDALGKQSLVRIAKSHDADVFLWGVILDMLPSLAADADNRGADFIVGARLSESAASDPDGRTPDGRGLADGSAVEFGGHIGLRRIIEVGCW